MKKIRNFLPDSNKENKKFSVCSKEGTSEQQEILNMKITCIKNKHGDLPVTLLVIGIFAICSLALFSFFYSDFKIKDSLKTLNLMEQVDSVKQDIFLYKNTDSGMIEKMEVFNNELEVEKNIFLKAREENGYYIINAEYRVEKGFLLWKKTSIIASAEYIVKDISN